MRMIGGDHHQAHSDSGLALYDPLSGFMTGMVDPA